MRYIRSLLQMLLYMQPCIWGQTPFWVLFTVRGAMPSMLIQIIYQLDIITDKSKYISLTQTRKKIKIRSNMDQP
jgi:intracellular septation protein A